MATHHFAAHLIDKFVQLWIGARKWFTNNPIEGTLTKIQYMQVVIDLMLSQITAK